jgi:ribonuclease III
LTQCIDGLDRKLGYHFCNRQLLECALTHRSAGAINNERLEFLGDAILNFVVASELFRQFPAATEGELSRLRASLVKRETLAALARALDLGAYLRLGSGEMKSGGHRRDSILADALEAVLGAVYLDGGHDVCSRLIAELFQPRIGALPEATSLTDPKTRLQEYLQSRKLPLPSYQVVEVTGEAHAQTFRVQCTLEGLGQTTQGLGSSRRRAEQDAAQRALSLLQHE